MTGPEMLSQYEDCWKTDKGAWFPGERVVYRGKDLFTEMNEFGWFELLCYGILGRELEPSKIKMIEKIIVIGTNFPDPRLWNNRISALAGSSRSTVILAASASNAVSEAIVYGYRPLIKSALMLQRFVNSSREKDGIRKNIEHELDANQVLYGYGRPVTTVDERNTPLLQEAEKLGYGCGNHAQMAFLIEEQLIDMGHKWRMNAAALGGAIILDLGLTPDEYIKVFIHCFSGGFMPCFIDAENKPEGSFFPFRCERVSYKGINSRKWVKIDG